MRRVLGVRWMWGAVCAGSAWMCMAGPVVGQVPARQPALDTLYPILGDSVAVRISGDRILGIRGWHRAVSAVVLAWEEAGVDSGTDGSCLRTPRPPLPPSRPRAGGADAPTATVSSDLLNRWARLFEPDDARCPHAPHPNGSVAVQPLAEEFRAELEAFRAAAEAARRSGSFPEAEYWRWIVLYREGLGMYRDYFERPGPALRYGIGGSWEPLPGLPYPVRAAAIATDGERVFVFGGSAAGNRRTGHTQILDPTTGTWVQGAPMSEAVEWSAAVYAGRRFHVLGGVTDRSAAVAEHRIYDPVEDAWTPGPELPSPAAGAAVALIDDRIFLVGGIDGPRAYSARVRVYDLRSGRWSETGPAPVARINWQAAAIDGAFWVAGGSGPGRTTSGTLYRFTPDSGRWTVEGQLPAPTEGYGGAEVDGRYCTAGGRVTPPSGSFNDPSSRVYCFVPAENRWLSPRPLPTAVEETGAVGLGGALYVLGGRISFDGVTGEVYRLRF